MGSKAFDIEKLRKFVNTPRVQAGGITTLNLCDIFINSSERNLVLSTIQRRFPHATGDLDAPEDWYRKLASLRSEQAYINAYTGQYGEDKAIERLDELGVEATPFDSLIHKDNDLVATDGTAYSVKSYSSESNFLNIAQEHPDSSNYVINSDLYARLESSGNLSELKMAGVNIIDGGWQHADAVKIAQERLGAITGDINDELYDGVIDDLPLVGGIVILCNLGADIHKYANDRITTTEIKQNVAVTGGKVAAAGGGAAAGGAAGAAIGSMIFPLAGTVIGAGVGAFVGAISGRGVVDWIGRRWKWGKSASAYRHFYSHYEDDWKYANNSIQDRIFRKDEILKDLETISAKRDEYIKQLDSNSEEPVTVAAILVDESKLRLECALEVMKQAAEKVQSSVEDFVIGWGIERFPRKRKESREAAELMYGSILAENAEWLLAFSPEDRAVFNDMKDEMKNSPNNPFKLRISKHELLKALSIYELEKGGQSRE